MHDLADAFFYCGGGGGNKTSDNLEDNKGQGCGNRGWGFNLPGSFVIAGITTTAVSFLGNNNMMLYIGGLILIVAGILLYISRYVHKNK